MKKLIINAEAKEEMIADYSSDELQEYEQLEQVRQEQELKPKDPTIQERIEALEMALLASLDL